MERMTKKVLAIIPARGGSKGLPKKNIINLVGKPLLAWTIESSLNSKYISKTIVSSDDDEILKIAHTYQALTIKRPSELALDTTPSEVVVMHVLEELKQQSEQYDYVVLLQPTSPLRNTQDIDEALEKLFCSNAKSLISVTKIDNKILKAFIIEDEGYIKGISNNLYPFMRRQDLPKTYISNGAIYIATVNEFIQKNSFFSDQTISYLMDETKSVDVDTKEDLIKIEKYIKCTKKKFC